MALGQYQFVGIRKNGTAGAVVEEGMSEKEARSKAKKTLKTITQCKRLGDLVGDQAISASHTG